MPLGLIAKGSSTQSQSCTKTQGCCFQIYQAPKMPDPSERNADTIQDFYVYS